MKQYASYRDSGIPWVGEMPDTWGTMPNKKIMSKKKEICSKWNGEDVMSLTMNGVIVRDLVNPSGKMPTTFDGYQYVDSDELLMCLFDIDVTPRCVGRVYQKGVTSPAYSRFQMNDNSFVGYYYYYYLMLDYTKELLHFSKNIRHSFTEEQLGALKVPYPPVEEQIAISEYLDTLCKKIDSMIKDTSDGIESYRQWRAAILHEYVTKGIDSEIEMKDSSIDWIGTIPSSWSVQRIKYFGEQWTYRAETNEGYIGLENIESGSGKYLPSKDKEFQAEGASISVAKGDVLFGKLRPYLAKCYVAEQEGCCSTEFIVIKPHNCDARYLKYVMLSPKFIDSVNMSTYGAKMPRANWDYIGNVYAPLPSLEDQRKIADRLESRLSEIDGLIVEKQELISDLENYKRSMIYEVVTGKRKVV